MSGADDLTNLFGKPDPSSPFRQGRIESFNPATGTNEVRVAGAILTNLPVLVGGDTVNFSQGDAVILLKFGPSWAILGRIVVPGNESLTAAAVDFYAGGAWSSDPGGLGLSFNITNAFQTHTLLTISVPAWANSALVTADSWVLAGNGSGTTQLLRCRTLIGGGGFANEVWETVPSGSGFRSQVAPATRTFNPGELGATIAVEGQVRADGPTWVTGGNAGYVSANAIFRRV